MNTLEAVNQIMREHQQDGLLKDVFSAMLKGDKAEADKCRKIYLSVRVNGDPYTQWKKIVDRLKYLLTCELFKVICPNDKNELYVTAQPTYEDAKHWVINHLDCSKEWVIYNITSEQ
jgi:hypothetical protein